MRQIVCDDQQGLGDLCMQKLELTNGWGLYYALGVEVDARLAAVIVYNNYQKHTDVCMHVWAAPGSGWASRSMLKHLFGYPFLQLGTRRVTGIVRASDDTVRVFNERLGFKREGLLRQGHESGDDLLLTGMLREECRWC